MEKGLIWIELEDGLRRLGCPICSIVAESTRRNFSFFLEEGVLDPGMRLRLFESGGWCVRHTLLLLNVESREWPDHMGSATVFESLVEMAERRLAEALRGLRRRRAPATSRSRQRAVRHAGDALRPRKACPACETELECEASYLVFFTDALFDPVLGPEMKTLYASSEGLCYRHLVGCFERCASPDQVSQLAELEQQKLVALTKEVSEYLRKHEHRYRAEPFGDEVDAWARAARKLAGYQPAGLDLQELADAAKRKETRAKERSKGALHAASPGEHEGNDRPV
jgi:hypothetical protein